MAKHAQCAARILPYATHADVPPLLKSVPHLFLGPQPMPRVHCNRCSRDAVNTVILCGQLTIIVSFASCLIVLYCIYTFIQRFLQRTPIRSASTARDPDRREQS